MCAERLKPLSRQSGPTALDRRRFLLAGGSAALTLAPAGAALARALETRSLSFIHTHTGEQLTAVYFQEGAYHEAGLDRISYLLRDFRTEEVHPIDPRVLDILYDVQNLAGRQEPYQVISGYRSPSTNSALRSLSHGVAEHSLHKEGRAIDVRMDGVPTWRMRDLALQMKRGGVGFYPKSDFVHLDCGRVRFW